MKSHFIIALCFTLLLSFANADDDLRLDGNFIEGGLVIGYTQPVPRLFFKTKK